MLDRQADRQTQHICFQLTWSTFAVSVCLRVCLSVGQGPECQQLDLLPVPIGSGLQQPLTSTWGGSIVHGDDGRLYMYV